MVGRLIGLVLAAAVLAGATVAGVQSARAHPGPLHIHSLRTSIVDTRSKAGPRYLVRVEADVCLRSQEEGDRAYPGEFRIKHFVVDRSSGSWGRPFRTVADDFSWIVSFGEGRGICGPIVVEDVMPDHHYGGLESPLGWAGHNGDCYGVVVEIEMFFVAKPVVTARANKRAIVTCRDFGPR